MTLDDSSDRVVTAPTCPHLGLWDDLSGYSAYPSTDNRCYHCRQPATPSLAHQEAYCLSGGQKDCPVYWQPRKKAFPPSLQAAEAFRPGQSALLRTALALALGVMAVGYAAFRFIPQVFSFPGRAMSSPPVAATIAPSVTPLPNATGTSAVSTSTLVPTSTALPRVHALELPFEVDGHTLLIHRVGAGDMFDTIDKEYQTTAEVVRALNYPARVSLLANTVIVIAQGMQTMDPALPAFRVRQVDGSATTIDDLVQQYHVEAAVLNHYNGCSDACSFSVGDWILIPVIERSTATP
jgi:hypothetical protein